MCLWQVNGRAVFNMTHAECVREIKSSGQYLRLECERYVISLTILPHTEMLCSVPGSAPFSRISLICFIYLTTKSLKRHFAGFFMVHPHNVQIPNGQNSKRPDSKLGYSRSRIQNV